MYRFQSMKYLLVCCVTSLIFLDSVSSNEEATVQVAAKYDDPVASTKKYEIRQAIQLKCNVSTDSNDKLEVTWTKNGKDVTKIDNLKSRVSLSHSGITYKLQINNGHENDSGNYSCIASLNGIPKNASFINLESTIYVKVPKDITVIEGETLRVICKVYGNPIPNIVWSYRNKTFTDLEGRIRIENDTENNVPNAVFVIDKAELEDQDSISCTGISHHTNEHSEPSGGTVRVKDKYAALWPFIGICLEVIVLCAIILVYEKKRNKTELEESDTDQSPEQKNTPDNGGKESNLRHRQ